MINKNVGDKQWAAVTVQLYKLYFSLLTYKIRGEKTRYNTHQNLAKIYTSTQQDEFVKQKDEKKETIIPNICEPNTVPDRSEAISCADIASEMQEII